MQTFHPAWILLVSLSMAAIPFVVLLGTSYLKVSIVFSVLRSGLGTQSTPGPMTVSAIALAVSIFVMAPTVESSFAKFSMIDSGQLQKTGPRELLATLESIAEPFQQFLKVNAGMRELEELSSISGLEDHSGGQESSAAPLDIKKSTFRILLPAFVLTELKEAFSMAFVLLLPFLVIDLIVSNVLVGMGMTMVSPVTVALPLKLLAFVFADGWLLLTKGLILSYAGGA